MNTPHDVSTRVPAGYLGVPAVTPEIQRMYDEDVADSGYVMNLTRLWAHSPELDTRLWSLMTEATRVAALDLRRRGVLVVATGSTLGDPYCSLAWGRRLAAEAGASTAASVLSGGEEGLSEQESALARWARKVAADATAVTGADVQELRDAGFSDAEILATTVYIAGRMAFSTVNSALGARPDAELLELAPAEVRAAVERRGRGRRAADEG